MSKLGLSLKISVPKSKTIPKPSIKIEPTIPYTYGAAIVAARYSEEAIKIYCSDEFRDYTYDYLVCTCNIIVGLDYETNSPALIFDKIGSE